MSLKKKKKIFQNRKIDNLRFKTTILPDQVNEVNFQDKKPKNM